MEIVTIEDKGKLAIIKDFDYYGSAYCRWCNQGFDFDVTTEEGIMKRGEKLVLSCPNCQEGGD